MKMLFFRKEENIYGKYTKIHSIPKTIGSVFLGVRRSADRLFLNLIPGHFFARCLHLFFSGANITLACAKTSTKAKNSSKLLHFLANFDIVIKKRPTGTDEDETSWQNTLGT